MARDCKRTLLIPQIYLHFLQDTWSTMGNCFSIWFDFPVSVPRSVILFFNTNYNVLKIVVLRSVRCIHQHLKFYPRNKFVSKNYALNRLDCISLVRTSSNYSKTTVTRMFFCMLPSIQRVRLKRCQVNLR